MTSLKSIMLAEDPKLEAEYDQTAIKRDIALMLRALRKKAGLTQTELAVRTGLSQSHISKIEAPTGGLPEIESCARYVHGCGQSLLISPVSHAVAAQSSGAELRAVI